MKGRVFAVAVAAALLVAAPSRASLTASETEQVRRGVATATDLPRVRAQMVGADFGGLRDLFNREFFCFATSAKLFSNG